MFRPDRGDKTMKRLSRTGIVITLLVVVAIVVFVVIQSRPASAQDTELTFETSPCEVPVTVEEAQCGTDSTAETIADPLRDQAEPEAGPRGLRTYSTTGEVTPGGTHTISAELPPESNDAQALINVDR